MWDPNEDDYSLGEDLSKLSSGEVNVDPNTPLPQSKTLGQTPNGWDPAQSVQGSQNMVGALGGPTGTLSDFAKFAKQLGHLGGGGGYQPPSIPSLKSTTDPNAQALEDQNRKAGTYGGGGDGGLMSLLSTALASA